MGFFSRKKREPVKDELLCWLDDADTAYSNALHMQKPQLLGNFFSRELHQRILEEISLGVKNTGDGLSRYKHVTWVKRATQDKPTFTKKVEYDHIQVTRGIYAPVGDDYSEEWVLTTLDVGRAVQSIRRLHNA